MPTMNTEPSALSPLTPQPEGKTAAQRPRPLSEFPAMAQTAAELLRTPTALAELSLEDARCVVEYMWLVGYAAGVTVLVEGDREHTGFMLLLLSGEVSVEAGGSPTLGSGSPMSALISVTGPGHLIGEMGVLDGAPRSTTCVAVSRVEAGALTRAALHKLIADQPTVGARLMAAVAQRLAERVRAADDQVRIYAQIAGKLQAEIEGLKRELGR